MNDTTVVLSGSGPKIRVKLPEAGKVTVVTNSGVKTISLDSPLQIKFAA